jgi:hypothetical protein
MRAAKGQSGAHFAIFCSVYNFCFVERFVRPTLTPPEFFSQKVIDPANAAAGCEFPV